MFASKMLLRVGVPPGSMPREELVRHIHLPEPVVLHQHGLAGMEQALHGTVEPLNAALRTLVLLRGLAVTPGRLAQTAFKMFSRPFSGSP